MGARWLLRIGTGIGVLALAFAAAAAQNLTGILAPERTLDAHADMLRPGLDIRIPADTHSPVPAVLLFHGCGGQRPMHDAYADALNEAGYAAVLVDSFTPRGIGRFAAMTQVCSGLRLHGQERAADVFAALAVVREHEAIDRDRLVLAGWSHGGWALLDAASFASSQARPPALSDGPASLHGVAHILAIYPYCSFPSRAAGGLSAGLPPISLVLAGRDRVAPARDCERLARRAVEAGADLDHEMWPGVTHAFDDPDAPALDPRMTFDPEAAARLQARLIEIVSETQD